mgnify:CR=1 FL=1|jgi:hypothetical protein
MNVDKIYAMLIVLTLAFFSVTIFKKSIKDKSKAIKKHYVDSISKFFSRAAIGVLLPILFFESFANHSEELLNIVSGVVIVVLY